MRSVIGLLLLGALAVGGCDRRSEPAQQANAAAPAVAQAGAVDRSHKGEAAPDMPFIGPDGKKTSLAAFRGKPVLLNLWATWCVPCVKEMPTLDALAGQKGDALTVIALSQDSDGAKVVDPYVAKAGLKHLKPSLDTDSNFSLAMAANLPTTILYGSDGKEIWRVGGEMDWIGAKAAVLLAEAR